MTQGYFETYADYSKAESSEKISLAIVEAAERLVSWVVHSGSVYSITNFDVAKIVSIEEDGTSVTEVSSLASVTAGTFFHDRENKTIYIETSGSVDPNTVFIAMSKQLYFSNGGVSAPHDLTASGFEVHWLSLLKNVSEAGPEFDNRNKLGVAIEGKGTIRLHNDQSFWKPIYDKLTFENQRVFVYSWHRTLPITEAKLLFKGRIDRKSYSTTTVTFSVKDLLNELRQPIDLSPVSDVSGVRVPDSQLNARQRRIYGQKNGLIPLNIDRTLSTGYPLSGTVSATAGSATVTGVSTSFLSELAPDDSLIIGGVEDSITIESIASDTSLTLSEEWPFVDQTSATFTVIPDRAKPYINRKYLVAGHELCEPTATVATNENFTSITVTDANDLADFRDGDEILVPTAAGTEVTTIRRISGVTVVFTTSLTFAPAPGATITKTSVFDVFIDDRELVYERDYDYSADTGILTLTDTAEINNARIRTVIGNVTFTDTSRSVTGSGTVFDSQIRPGDLIRAKGEADFFRVLSVESDTALTLGEAATYSSSSSAAQFKSPDYIDEQNTIVACSALGITDDGDKTGSLIDTGPKIVEHILKDIGLTDDIDTASFTEAKELERNRLGLIIPDKNTDQAPKKSRDVIDQVNKSVFGALIQSQTFELQYKVLAPQRADDEVQRLDEGDILSFTVKSDSSRIARRSVIEYDLKEHDGNSNSASTPEVNAESDDAKYLVKTSNEFRLTTSIIDQEVAQRVANRWAFLNSRAITIINFKTKLQTSQLNVTDKVEFVHRRIFERLGSELERRVSAIQKIKKSPVGVSLEIEDLRNSFSICGAITKSTANTFNTSSDRELMVNGFVTDSNGMQDNDRDTFRINSIY